MLKVTVNEYIAEIEFTKQKRILVEGWTDKIAISKLIGQYTDPSNGDKTISLNVEIDTAERIKHDGVLLNSQKLKNVIMALDSRYHETRVVGFIDREFDGFVLEPDIDDISRSHQTTESLVWSRGHSLENYFFDLRVIRRSVFALSTTDQSQVLNLFEDKVSYVLQIACAITLSALELGRQHNIPKIFARISKSLRDSELKISEAGVELELSSWQSSLTHVLNSSELVSSIEEIYKQNLIRVQATDGEIVRWLCHGHIGMYLVAKFYNTCQQVFGTISRDQTDLLNPDHSLKFAVLASFWATLALTDDLEHPRELIDKIR